MLATAAKEAKPGGLIYGKYASAGLMSTEEDFKEAKSRLDRGSSGSDRFNRTADLLSNARGMAQFSSDISTAVWLRCSTAHHKKPSTITVRNPRYQDVSDPKIQPAPTH